MPRLGALLLLTAGAALGSYGYLFPPSDNSTDLAEITRISAAPDRVYRNDTAVRTFSPASPVFHEVIPADSDAAIALPAPKSGTWTTVVASGQAVVTPLRSSKPGDAETRAALAQDLQLELKRVGCYGGEITGTWNASTRRAMAAFMDRANATLPINEPDYVLLALVQSHHEIACTAECPSGQVVAESGRCMPRAVVAQASKRSKRLEERRLAEARLAGTGSQPAVASAEPEKLPWLTDNQSAVAPVAVRPDLPPGRMSIGGPVVSSPPEGISSPTPELRQAPVVIVQRDGSGPANADGSPAGDSSRVAALGRDADSDDLSVDANADPNAVPLAAEGVDANAPKTKSPSRSEDRPRRNHYASAGRTRRGDPRPGTMRYNLMQSLGGIY